jgi:hypothetical protein
MGRTYIFLEETLKNCPNAQDLNDAHRENMKSYFESMPIWFAGFNNQQYGGGSWEDQDAVRLITAGNIDPLAWHHNIWVPYGTTKLRCHLYCYSSSVTGVTHIRFRIAGLSSLNVFESEIVQTPFVGSGYQWIYADMEGIDPGEYFFCEILGGSALSGTYTYYLRGTVLRPLE